jgi:D,D-heptose 1,7-bisphosphate phosphatase
MPGATLAILAGGKGTRLAGRSGDLPKPMVPIMGRPVLEHLVSLAKAHGFTDILLLVHHRHEAIRAHFGDGSAFGVRLAYSLEEQPRGTAGALRDALPLMADRFLLLYGDTFADVNLGRLWQTHLDSRADATLFLHPNDHPADSDLVEVADDGRVMAVHPYPRADGADHANLVNAALYAMNREGLAELIPETGSSDIARNLFPLMLDAGRRLQAHVTPEYIKDMGTPGRLDRVEADIRSGRVERLSDRKQRPAVFLDRDGTLNKEKGHLNDPDALELLPGAGEAVRRLNQAGLLALIVTNQPVIARGELSFEGLKRIHARLDGLLGAERAYLDGLYFCPHHPDSGFAGEVASLKGPCACRKPEIGLIEAAIRDFGIDPKASWIVGDTTSDIAAGKAAGLRTVLVQTGAAGKDGRAEVVPDHVADSVADAVSHILDKSGIQSQDIQP